jgi:hypothetical protein
VVLVAVAVAEAEVVERMVQIVCGSFVSFEQSSVIDRA